VTLLATLTRAGYVPVIAPVAAAASPVGNDTTAVSESPLNVNGDDAAAAVAIAIGARELLLVSDVPAVRIGGAPVANLTADAATHAIADGEIAGGMVAKVSAALGALGAGVARVRIGGLGMLIGTDRGTLLTLAESAARPWGEESSVHGAAA
jgi:acetylglutamate kinase